MSEGFKAECFDDLASLEEYNFWFKVRNRIIIWAIKKYAITVDSFLEIGCGTGFVTQAVARELPHAHITGSEYFEEGLFYARQRTPDATFIQLDARNIPHVSDFSVIGAFDVLEHIKEDELVLEQIHKALSSDGRLCLTVPQHQWLWSQADDYACHERRYSAIELHDKLKKSGIKVIRSTSFVSFLLPAMLLSRLSNKDPDSTYDATSELRIHPILNKLMEYFMALDFLLIRIGITLPLGGSRLVVTKKINRS